jgi:hypothetical protein
MSGRMPVKAKNASAYIDLLSTEIKVVNLGLEGFAQDLRAGGVKVANIEWSPPAGGDARMAALLVKLGM